MRLIATSVALLLALLSIAAARGFLTGVGSGGICVGAACTSFSVSGPPAGIAGTPSSAFTVTLSTGSFSGAQTITISDGLAGAARGVFTPSVGSPGTGSVVVTPTAASTSFTFTYTAVQNGTYTFAFANSAGWTNHSPMTFVATETYTATGPSAGVAGTPSSNFTITLQGGAKFTGAQTITISDGGQGGTLTPSVGAPGVSSVTVTPLAASTSFTFTYTAVRNGSFTLAFSNGNGVGFTDPASLPFTATETYTASGPSAGTTGTPSTAFTVSLSGGAQFTGTQTITITGGAGGAITPSVGGSGIGSVTVTPPAATSSFTFTYTAPIATTVNIAFTNGQGWADPASLPYTSTGGVVTCTNSLDFTQACNSQYIGAIL